MVDDYQNLNIYLFTAMMLGSEVHIRNFIILTSSACVVSSSNLMDNFARKSVSLFSTSDSCVKVWSFSCKMEILKINL